MPETILIAGAGSLGLEFARLRASPASQVLALRRSEKPDPPYCHFVAADLISGAGLEALPSQVDLLLFCPSPDRREPRAYEQIFIDGLNRLRDKVQAKRSLFVSSTAVYGEDSGQWVDELCAENPNAFNGEILLRAESNVLLDSATTVARLSGLVKSANGRILQKACGSEPGTRRWTNRIHVLDAALALSHLADLSAFEPVYCVSDNRPVREFEMLDEIREYRGLPKLGAAPDSVESGKRVCNRRLRSSGWEPRFADFRAIYC